MRSLVVSVVCAHVLLLTAACNSNIYVGHDEVSQLAGAQALATPHAELEIDAGLALDPVDASAPVQTDAAAPTSMFTSPPAIVSPPPIIVTPMAPDCVAPEADCDGRADDGCETDLSKSRLHCGACNNACRTPDCTCENGKLVLHCPTGRADCDADVTNGCETDLQTSADHCGTCKHACHTKGRDVVSAACVSGQCELTCQASVTSEADCDHDPDNGCETYLWFDAKNCGQCGKRCLTNCEAGICML